MPCHLIFEIQQAMVFSIDIHNNDYSKVGKVICLISFNNNTLQIFAYDIGLDLDANEYLLAIDDEIEIATNCDTRRFSSNYLTDPICQIDAIDINNLARANFESIQ
jgi:hypothetical protein